MQSVALAFAVFFFLLYLNVTTIVPHFFALNLISGFICTKIQLKMQSVYQAWA